MPIAPHSRGLCLCLIAVIVMLSGCGPYRAAYTTTAPLETSEKVTFVDIGLKKDVRVDDVQSGTTEGGRLNVTASFFNTTNHAIECRIRLKFRGADGSQIEETSWMPLVLDRREVTLFAHKSLSSKATDFSILLRLEK